MAVALLLLLCCCCCRCYCYYRAFIAALLLLLLLLLVFSLNWVGNGMCWFGNRCCSQNICFLTTLKIYQAQSYYCTLLPTFLEFPGCLRLLCLPITAIGVGSRCLLYTTTSDIATAVLLATVGSYSFYNTLTLALYSLCSSTPSLSGSATLKSMLLWHYVILAALVVGLALQISVLVQEGASPSGKSHHKRSW